MRQKQVVSEQEVTEKCLKIAEIISNKDIDIMQDLRESFESPKMYIDKYHEHLSEDYMLNEKEMKDFAADKWMLMVDILELHGYICSRDWKDELQDFLYFLCQTKRAVSENITFDESDSAFSEEDDISIWSALIDDILAGKNLVVGNIDTDSDQYTLFICTVEELILLKEYSSVINHRIDFAKDS